MPSSAYGALQNDDGTGGAAASSSLHHRHAGAGADIPTATTTAHSSSQHDHRDFLSSNTLRTQRAAPFHFPTYMKSSIPSFTWLPTYPKHLTTYLPGDLTAGITVGLMVIPQALGYASVAGLPSIYGLYSAFLGTFIYALAGGCKDISIGPTAILALLSFQTTGGDIDLTIQLTFLSGICQLLMSLLHIGELINFISLPVLSGFTSAASIQICITQVGKILGYKTRSEIYYCVYDIFNEIEKMRWGDCVLGLMCVAVLYGMSQLKRFFPTSRIAAQISLARNALIVILTTIMSYAIYHSHSGNTSAKEDAVPWKLVGHIPQGLPEPRFPTPTSSVIKEHAGYIILSSIVGYLESIAIAKTFARQNGYVHLLKYNHELFVIGVCNTLSSMFRSLPVTGSFSRTAVASQAGARTQLQGIFTGLVVMCALLFATSAFEYIPKCVLAAVVITAAGALVDIPIFFELWLKYTLAGKIDFFILCVSFLGCLFLDIQYGIGIGVGVSLAYVVWRMARPVWSVKETVEVEIGVDGGMEKQHQLTVLSHLSSSAIIPHTSTTISTTTTTILFPSSLLHLQISTSFLFFNITHLIELIQKIELEYFELVWDEDAAAAASSSKISVGGGSDLNRDDEEEQKYEENEYHKQSSTGININNSSNGGNYSDALLSQQHRHSDAHAGRDVAAGAGVVSSSHIQSSSPPASLRTLLNPAYPNLRLRTRMRTLILDCSSCIQTDITSSKALYEMCCEMENERSDVGVRVYFIHLADSVQHTMLSVFNEMNLHVKEEKIRVELRVRKDVREVLKELELVEKKEKEQISIAPSKNDSNTIEPSVAHDDEEATIGLDYRD